MPLLLVGIGVLLAAAVALAASQQSHAWADAIVRGFTAWIVKIPLVGSAVERLIVSGATWIANKLGHVYLGLQHRFINWIGGLGHYVWMIANATLDWPVELVTFARWLLGREIPRLIHALPNSVSKLVHAAQAALSALERDVGRLYARLPGQLKSGAKTALLALIGPFLAPLRWLNSVWHRIQHAAAHAGGIAVPWIEVPKLRRAERSLEKRLGKVWPLLGVAGAVALLARALGISRACVRSGNVGKLARRVCGLDSSVFESLLLDLVAITSVVSVVEFANDLRAVEDEAIAVMGRLVREWPS